MTARNATSPRDRTQTEQSVGTPQDFFGVVDSEFPIRFDLAADESNAKTESFFSEEDNSLIQPWHHLSGWLWANPPFCDIAPWVAKAYAECQRGARVVMLVPASVGSRWYAEWVHGKAEVRFLTGRLTFQGHTQAYPKDLLLAVYERGRFPQVHPWDWRSRLQSIRTVTSNGMEPTPGQPTPRPTDFGQQRRM